ncbi:hypothetical protein [Pseudooceanicola nanhaiensis]|uniref:hypothetical protein n=1 Tax=Pseudooceanicola nanhaiensis TaxID=375761 RepID=UPI0040589B93
MPERLGRHAPRGARGDFNVGPESETLAILSRDGLTEQVTAHAEAGTRTSHYRKPMRFADYMLVNDAARVQDFRVVRSPRCRITARCS